MVYDSMNMSVGQYQAYGNAANYADHSQYSERPPTPPSPSERSDSPPPQQLLAHGNCLFCSVFRMLFVYVLTTCLFVPRWYEMEVSFRLDIRAFHFSFLCRR